MKLSVLEKVLLTERFRPKMGSVGHATPLLCEYPIEETVSDCWGTNLQGSLLPVRRGSSGTIRHAFYPCPLGEEDRTLPGLVSKLEDAYGTAPSLESAIDMMASNGMQACNMVVPDTYYQGSESYFGVDIHRYPLSVGLLIGAPAVAGIYFRSRESISLLLMNTRTAWQVFRL